jgi:pimeloyl-ACP methyl ester carboxylesterase
MLPSIHLPFTVSPRLRVTASLLLLLAVFLAGCAQSTTTAVQSTLPLADCQLSVPGQSQVKARCGSLSVPEDPANPSGKQIALNIAVVKAVSRDPAPDPIFLLAGGPGQAATQAFLLTIFPIERLRFDRDIVLIDQRGTGNSNPLVCPDPERADGSTIGADIPIDRQVAEISDCRESLGTDPRLYTTEIAMHDLDAARAALGYEQINLLGVSYGTRAALEYLRLFPERVRTITLDGIVPPGWALGQSTTADAQRALDKIFARCASNSACQSAFPDLPAEFARLMDDLDAHPVEVTVAHPRSGEPVKVSLSRATVGSAVQLMSYSDITAALLPLAIHSAATGDFTMLASLYIQNEEGLSDSISTGMYYSVVCAEDVPLLSETIDSAGTYLKPRVDDVRALCKAFLPDPAPAGDVQKPLSSSVPALLISGEADPVTPPANGEQIAKMLSNSRHLILPGMGHNNFYVGCLPAILDQFISSASVANLDTSCVTSIHPQPFFLSPVGPNP